MLCGAGMLEILWGRWDAGDVTLGMGRMAGIMMNPRCCTNDDGDG